MKSEQGAGLLCQADKRGPLGHVIPCVWQTKGISWINQMNQAPNIINNLETLPCRVRPRLCIPVVINPIMALLIAMPIAELILVLENEPPMGKQGESSNSARATSR